MMITKKSFKYLTLMLAIIMLITSLSACSKRKNNSNDELRKSDNISANSSESSDSSHDDKSSDNENSSQTDVSNSDESLDESAVPDISEPDISQPDISDEPEFIDVTRIEFESTVIEIELNTITPIVVNVYPDNATNKEYTLSSSNDELLTVMLKNVMGLTDGETTLTVTSVSDPEVTATCRVIIGDGAEDPHVCSLLKTKVVNATCDSQGYSVYKCSCGVTENKDFVDSLGHSESEWKTISEATTDSEGLKRKSCTRCEITIEEEKIPKIADTHTCSFVKTETISATCTNQGYTVYACSCGKTEKKNYVSALGHEKGEWKIITEATTTSTGIKKKSCTRCGITMEEETIPKIVESHTCSFTKSKTVAATCTEKGYTIYKCSCGATENRDYVTALGHKESDWVTITEATTASTGLKQKTCTRCGVILDEEVIDKLDGNVDNKYNVPDTIDNITLLEERTLCYINQYRLQDGVQEATFLWDGKTYQYAKMRAEQLVDNFEHDTEDIRAVATELEFGVYVPEHEETYYDWETDTVISTGNITPAYYQPGCSEAITKGYGQKTTVDAVAQEIATVIYNSDAHWSYVGASTTVHITVGAYLLWDEWFICIATSGSAEYD